MTDSNQDGLPDGWRRLKVADTLQLRNGRPFKPTEWSQLGRPIIRIQNLKSPDAPYNRYEGDLPDQFRAVSGDLLFAWSGTPGTSFGAHIWKGDDAWVNQHIFRVDFSSDTFDPSFLRLALNNNVRDYIEQAQGGVGLAHITKKKLNASTLVVPPLPDQRRIVERLDEIDSFRSAATAHLARTRVILSNFRRAVLAAACSGRLTEGWRAEHAASSWVTLPASEVCEKVQSGGTPKTGFTHEPGIPFLKVYNIVNQRINFGYRSQYVPVDVHRGALKKSIAYPGDVVMNIVGPPLGKVAIISSDFQEWNLNQAITIFRPGPKIIGEWLYIYLCSGTFMDNEDLVTRGSAGQSNISLTQCRNLEIPVPLVDEQQEIVRRIDELLGVGETILTQIKTASSLLDRTGQAALAKAFRGELFGRVG